MNKLLNLICTALLAWGLSLITPWWGIMPAALIVSFVFPLKGGNAFFIPFLSIFILWGIQAYLIGSNNDFTMAGKIAELLPLQGNVHLLILITALLGGIAAAFSGLLGKQLKILVS